jgi:hypothetical protein
MVPLIFINLLPNEDPQVTTIAPQSLPPATTLDRQLTNLTADRAFIPDLLPEPIETPANNS